MAQDLGPGVPPMVMDFESLEGVAPPAAAQMAGTPAGGAAGVQPAVGSVAAPPSDTSGGKEVAQDPFQQTLQR